MIHKLGRIFKFAFQNIGRNIWLSMVTVSMMVVALLAVNFFILGNAVLTSLVQTVEEKVSMTLYFKQTAQSDDILAIAEKLRTVPQVKDVEYISKDAALERFKKKYAAEQNSLIEDSVRELDVNPLSASIVVRARSLDAYPLILEFIQTQSYDSIIEKKNVNDRSRLIEKLKVMKSNLVVVALGVIIFFSMLIALIIFNTIRITIYSRRREIGIMKLVGATNSFIRTPLFLEGIFYALFSLVLIILFVFPLLSIVQAPLARFFDGSAFDVIGYFNDHFFLIFGYQLLGLCILTLTSSSIAIGRYLKV